MIHNKKDHKFCTKDSNQCNKLIKSLLKPKFSVSQNLTVPLKTHQTESYINVRNLKLIPRNKNPVEKAHSQIWHLHISMENLAWNLSNFNILT